MVPLPCGFPPSRNKLFLIVEVQKCRVGSNGTLVVAEAVCFAENREFVPPSNCSMCNRLDLPVYVPVELSAAGLADGELFGLNKRGNLNLNLRGVGDATGVGVGLGLADSPLVAFLRIRLAVGEAAADSAGEGDTALSTDGVASDFFCFAGGGDSMGVPVSSCDRTCPTQMIRPIPNSTGRSLLPMTCTYLRLSCRAMCCAAGVTY